MEIRVRQSLKQKDGTEDKNPLLPPWQYDPRLLPLYTGCGKTGDAAAYSDQPAAKGHHIIIKCIQYFVEASYAADYLCPAKEGINKIIKAMVNIRKQFFIHHYFIPPLQGEAKVRNVVRGGVQ